MDPRIVALALVVALPLLQPARADEPPPLDGRDGRNLALDQFRPQSMLRVDEHLLTRAKFPVVDVHVHPRVKMHEDPQQLDEFVRIMDAQNIAVCVSLDGGLGARFVEHAKFLNAKYADRWVIFANVEWQGDGKADDPASWDCLRPDFGRRTAALLAEAKTQGAAGLKVFKQLGLTYRDADGSVLAIDDPRWDPIWSACGELGLPVLIHSADPAAFFTPIDEKNERWEELHRRPEWSFYGPQFPKREEVLRQFTNIVERHPRTTFIGAHVANNAEDLATVGAWLDKYPNLYAETAARIAELGRQPVTARKFLVKYADRVLFGTDGPRSAERLYPHWRFFETHDEYFRYSEAPFPPQGFWNIYGVGLPDDVLKKIYHENAARLIPGVAERLKDGQTGRTADEKKQS
jgi:predicted TIM-barrel fold metal-dependent hydrolase